MGWTQDEFDFCEPRYFFNALRGAQRQSMEQARMTAYYASLIHSAKGLKISDFGLFPWENPADYAPKFSKVNPDAWAFMEAWKFPDEIKN